MERVISMKDISELTTMDRFQNEVQELINRGKLRVYEVKL